MWTLASEVATIAWYVGALRIPRGAPERRQCAWCWPSWSGICPETSSDACCFMGSGARLASESSRCRCRRYC